MRDVPLRKDLKSVLLIGSGPIVIGQACEFDYSGTQALKALREEGLRLVLVNSNPATIMTDPELADRTYIEPMTVATVAKIIEQERPDAILPTVGGQTALNLAIELAETGVLDRFKVELIGARLAAIKKAEDRDLFKAAMIKIGLEVPASEVAHSLEDADAIRERLSLPLIIRPSRTLGGTGGSIARAPEEYRGKVAFGLDLSPSHEVLIEQSVEGWKEFELEVMRDSADNVVIVCSIENLDPMGVHTGDSITVAPAQTLTDKEYQLMRDASLRIIREIGVDTGGSNIQFAIEPSTGRMVVIEMNPRVSRSSALASKATGFPIAKIAARLAVGYTLDEIPNDITKMTPSCFEPTIDYVVTKIPRFAFEKFRGAVDELGPQMKSVGEAMAIGRTFKESLQKALRSLEISSWGLESKVAGLATEAALAEVRARLETANSSRIYYLADALRLGLSHEEIYQLSKIDPWFIDAIAEIVATETRVRRGELTPQFMRELKAMGFSDRRIADLRGADEMTIFNQRRELGVTPVFKLVVVTHDADGCDARLACLPRCRESKWVACVVFLWVAVQAVASEPDIIRVQAPAGENLAVVSAWHRTSCSLCRAVRVACREGRTRIQAARSGRAAPFALRFAPCPLGRTGPGRAERLGRGEVVAGRRRLRPRPVVAGGAGGGGSSSLARASHSSFLSTCSRCPNSRSIPVPSSKPGSALERLLGALRFGQAEHLDRRALTAENPDLLDARLCSGALRGRGIHLALPGEPTTALVLEIPKGWIPSVRLGRRCGPLPAKSAAEALWENRRRVESPIDRLAPSRASRFARGVGKLRVSGTSQLDPPRGDRRRQRPPVNWMTEWVLELGTCAIPKSLEVELDMHAQLLDVQGPGGTGFRIERSSGAARVIVTLGGDLRNATEIRFSAHRSRARSGPLADSGDPAAERHLDRWHDDCDPRLAPRRGGMRRGPCRPPAVRAARRGRAVSDGSASRWWRRGRSPSLSSPNPRPKRRASYRGQLFVSGSPCRLECQSTGPPRPALDPEVEIDLSPGWTAERVVMCADQANLYSRMPPSCRQGSPGCKW